MRITFLAPGAHMSGGARVISIYARELERRGHDVQVVVALGLRPRWRDRVRHLVRGRWERKPTRQPSHFDPIEHMLVRLDRLGPIRPADCQDADVIVATWWETAEWMARMPTSKGRHVHFVQGYEAFEHMPKERVHAVLRLPNRKITISQWLDEMLVDRFGNTDVHLVPNGVDMAQFHAEPRERGTPPTVGMLYHTAPYKNMGDGIAAFLGLSQVFPDARLVMFGTEVVSDEVLLPKGTVCHRLPAQNAIRDIYAACDVWVCSSTSEGFHLPPLEAMACRCPVVTTPVGVWPDIIEEGENGFVVPIGDVPAMTDRLVSICQQDAASWRRMSAAAFRTARAHDWDHSVTRFEQALRF